MSHRRQIILALCSVAIAVVTITRLLTTNGRPFLDRFMGYEIIDAVFDSRSQRYLELGRLWDFGSQGFELGVFKARVNSRRAADLGMPLIAIVNPNPYPETIEFDGMCYFIKSEFREGMTTVVPEWVDNAGDAKICVYLLTPDGKRIDHAALGDQAN